VELLIAKSGAASKQALRGAGGTFFMLDQLQPDADALWGGDTPQGSVVACDFYNAGAGAAPLNFTDPVDKKILKPD
jgi:hypothetical protein